VSVKVNMSLGLNYAHQICSISNPQTVNAAGPLALVTSAPLMLHHHHDAHRQHPCHTHLSIPVDSTRILRLRSHTSAIVDVIPVQYR
jgi:hypothetical protein